ncbi:MAG: four helix bundle protein [Candidatus Kaiserbacteria bacterium]|nr:four helix bundle protein [Candidatus Kaiserbacteria bacterium]
MHRYSLGTKIDTLLCEVIQYASSALFVPIEQKALHIQKSLQSLDTAKILLRVAEHAHIMETKQYIALTDKLVEIGKMLGGWHNQVISQKENSRRV